MKFLFLFLIMLSFNCFSGGFYPKSKIGICESITVYTSLKGCLDNYNESCLSVPDTYNCNYHELREFSQVEENNTSCLTDCDTELENLICDEGFEKRKGIISVYCYKEIQEKIVVNGAKKIEYDANIAQESMKKVERADAIQTLKESAVTKSWNDLTAVERKILLGLEVTDLELGLD